MSSHCPRLYFVSLAGSQVIDGDFSHRPAGVHSAIDLLRATEPDPLSTSATSIPGYTSLKSPVQKGAALSEQLLSVLSLVLIFCLRLKHYEKYDKPHRYFVS